MGGFLYSLICSLMKPVNLVYIVYQRKVKEIIAEGEVLPIISCLLSALPALKGRGMFL